MILHGNSEARNSGQYRSGALSHAYIIWGGSEEGRSGLADQLASAIVCEGSGHKPCLTCVHCEKASRHIHPDIITVDKAPDAREIYVDQVRALKEDAVIIPNEASRKAYIIRHAEDMNVPAQNALLKLLEEPPASASFILMAENSAGLLPTVRSRCVEIAADRESPPTPPTIREDAAAFYKALTGGPIKLAEFLFAMEKLDKIEFAEFIKSAKAYLVSRMREQLDGGKTALTPEYLMKAVEVLDRAGDYMEYNVSIGHITGMLCAELIR